MFRCNWQNAGSSILLFKVDWFPFNFSDLSEAVVHENENEAFRRLFFQIRKGKVILSLFLFVGYWQYNWHWI